MGTALWPIAIDAVPDLATDEDSATLQRSWVLTSRWIGTLGRFFSSRRIGGFGPGFLSLCSPSRGRMLAMVEKRASRRAGDVTHVQEQVPQLLGTLLTLSQN